jgi:hypothetical protein
LVISVYPPPPPSSDPFHLAIAAADEKNGEMEEKSCNVSISAFLSLSPPFPESFADQFFSDAWNPKCFAPIRREAAKAVQLNVRLRLGPLSTSAQSCLLYDDCLFLTADVEAETAFCAAASPGSPSSLCKYKIPLERRTFFLLEMHFAKNGMFVHNTVRFTRKLAIHCRPPLFLHQPSCTQPAPSSNTCYTHTHPHP